MQSRNKREGHYTGLKRPDFDRYRRMRSGGNNQFMSYKIAEHYGIDFHDWVGNSIQWIMYCPFGLVLSTSKITKEQE